jgi:hypothetical protein
MAHSNVNRQAGKGELERVIVSHRELSDQGVYIKPTLQLPVTCEPIKIPREVDAVSLSQAE